MLKFHLSRLAVAGLSLCLVHPALANTFQEDFSAPPRQKSWGTFGDAGLFQWNATNQNLEVTWDSSRQNSYFFHSLGTVLAKTDDFSFSFDLRLSGFAAGINPSKPSPFSLSLALLNLERATQTNFVRGTGADSPQLVEFSFFPDPGGAWIYGPSLTSILVDSTGTNWSTGGFAGQALIPDDLFHVGLTYTASNQTLQTVITRDGEAFGQVSDAHLGVSFLDFRLDTFAICSYSDASQDPMYAGSILAHGTVDNIALTLPPLPISLVTSAMQAGTWQVQFLSRSQWVYTLERTEDLLSWTPVSASVAGDGANLLLQDPTPPPGQAFYRVRTQRP